MLTHIVVMLILNKNETKKKQNDIAGTKCPYVHVQIYDSQTNKYFLLFLLLRRNQQGNCFYFIFLVLWHQVHIMKKRTFKENRE